MNLSLDLFKHCIVLFERSKLLRSPFSLGRDGVEMLGSGSQNAVDKFHDIFHIFLHETS